MGSLGELIVSITTDMTSLNAGLKSAEDRVKATSGKITEVTNKIGVTLTAVGAVVTGAYALMIKSAVDYGDQLYEVSQQTGIAVEKLSELKYIAEQTESSFEAVAQGFKFLNRNIYEAINGNDKASNSFRVLGIALRDELTGRVLTADEAFLKIADRFKGLQDESAKTALAMQIFGRGGQALIPVLNLGSDGITRLSQEAHRLGVVLTAENAKAIDDFSDGTKDLKASLGGLWLQLSLMLIPALKDITAKATNFVVKLKEWAELHPKLSKSITEWGLALGVVLTTLGIMVLTINNMIKALQTLQIVLGATILQMKVFTTFRLGGLLTDIAILTRSIGILYPLALVAGAAFAGWKIGRVLSEMTGLDNLLSGPDGVFTKMFKWLDKNEAKVKSIQRGMLAIGTLGISELLRKKESSPTSTPASTSATSPAAPTVAGETEQFALNETINLLERHAQKLKELNEDYVSGRINAQQYYEAVQELHKDGLDIKQQELDLLQQSIEMENLATDAELQKIYVMQEGIQTVQEYQQIKAEMANQELMDQQNTLSAATNLLQTLQNMHKTVAQGMYELFNLAIQKMSTGLSSAISGIILGTKSASEAFKEFGEMMLTSIVEFFVQWGIQALIALTLGKLIAAVTIAQANAIAAAWLPAALFASVATLGGADAAGAAGLTAAAASAVGIMAGMRTASAASSGLTTLAEGGIVTRPTLALIGEAGPEAVIPLESSGGVVGDININIESPIIASDVDIDDLADRLGSRIQEKLRYARSI